MKVLMVYPEFPDSFWSFRGTLPFIGKRAVMPPLGLITIAALFPKEWEVRLVDMNIEALAETDLRWADLVFLSAMVAQKRSLFDAIGRACDAQCTIVVGGPYPTSYRDEIEKNVPGLVHHYFFGEAEQTFPLFVEDLKRGKEKKVYDGPRQGDKPQTDVTKSPTPRFDLLHLDAYSSMAIQWSRGCPFDCEFCDITVLFGRIPRLKTTTQVLAELQTLYDLGWRGPVFFVDDNFIGNKKEVAVLLREVRLWQEKNRYPFSFFTEASIDLASYQKLLVAMQEARFSMVFVGIESVSDKALKDMHKGQNLGHGKVSARAEMLTKIRTIQAAGMEVSGGFIVGSDGDVEFTSLVEFIEEAGIPMAMVGLLSAIRETNLWKRLEREGRLLAQDLWTGNNADPVLNFVPQLPLDHVLAAFREVLERLYGSDLRNYFKRCSTMLEHLGPRHPGVNIYTTGRKAVPIILRSLARQLPTRHGPAYAMFLLRVIFTRPRSFPQAVEYALKGYHFMKVAQSSIAAL